MSSAFTPDARLAVQVRPSPNHGERRGCERPDMLVLHYTGMPNEREALERLCAPESEVSAHYVVLEAGTLIQCVPESRRAWHAGQAFWAGATDINSCSIGIEIANPGHDYGYPAFPPGQIAAVIALCRDIVARHLIRPERLLAHSDVAPARKQDPGEKFPWDALHAEGLGHWVEPTPLTISALPLQTGDRGPEVAALQECLSRYGYAVGAAGEYDAATADAVRAFQRHFRPGRVDGAADVSTRDTLDRLLAALP